MKSNFKLRFNNNEISFKIKCFPLIQNGYSLILLHDSLNIWLKLQRSPKTLILKRFFFGLKTSSNYPLYISIWKCLNQ